MKCNSKGKIDSRVLQGVLEAARAELLKEMRPQLEAAADVSLKSWELCLALTLHDMGFGKKRIPMFFNTLKERYKEFDEGSSITDLQFKGDKLTNMSTTFIKGMRELEQDGIDCRELLNVSELIINDVDVLKALDKIMGKDTKHEDKNNA